MDRLVVEGQETVGSNEQEALSGHQINSIQGKQTGQEGDIVRQKDTG